MAYFYGNTISSHWRAYGLYETSSTNTDYTIKLHGGFQSISWGYDLNGVTCKIEISGTTKSGTGNVYTSTGESKNVRLVSNLVKKITKTHSAQTITLKTTINRSSASYHAGTSTGSTTVTVPAKPSYAVKYNANGGSGTMTNSTKWYGETLTLKSNAFTRANYAFKGWATSASGSVAYGNGASYTANSAVTLYAVWERVYTTPNPPTSVSATRNSDTTLSVTWTNNSAIPRDYANLYVYVQTDNGSHAQVVKLGSTATNYSWSGAQPNKRYRFAVRAWNSAGYSSYAYSGYVYTTPAAPASVNAVKATASTVGVTVTAGAMWATSHEVERTADEGVTWTSIGTVAGAGGTYTDTNPPAGSVRYRARAVIGTLYSAYVESNDLVTLTAPLAPTLTSYPPAAILAGSTATLTWLPNHPDGTEQAKAEVEVTVGGVASTIAINDDTTTADLSSYVATPETVSVRVRTYGLYNAWGAWSDTISFTSYAAPVVTIDAPAYDGEVMTALPVSVQWTATDVTGISSQVLRLFDGDGVLLKSWTLAGNVSQFDLDQSTYFLANNSTYSVTVTVTAGSTLQATATRLFSIDYLGPAKPTADLWWDEGALSCAITVGDGESPVAPTAILGVGAGSAVEVTDGTLHTLAVEGESVQDGTPTPSDPVAIESAQGWNLASVSSLAFNAGNTTICDLGQDVTFDSIIMAFDADNLAYTVNGGAVIDFRTDGGAHSYVSANNLLSYFAVNSVINGNVFYRKVSATFRYIDIYARSDANAKFTSGTFENIQVIAGNTLMPYVEHDALGVLVHGTNLMHARDYSKSSSAAYYLELNVNSNTRLPPFELEEGVTYTLSADIVSSVEPFSVSVGAGNGAYSADIATESNLTNGRVSVTLTPTAAQLASGNILAFRAPRYGTSTTFSCTVSNIQLERGSTATEYEPYRDTTTPIDLQGHELRSLPDGTKDELTVDSAGNVTLVQRVGYTTTAATDGITGTVGEDVMSESGTIADGFDVIYKLASESTVSLGTITMPTVSDGDTVEIVGSSVVPSIGATWALTSDDGWATVHDGMTIGTDPATLTASTDYTLLVESEGDAALTVTDSPMTQPMEAATVALSAGTTYTPLTTKANATNDLSTQFTVTGDARVRLALYPQGYAGQWQEWSATPRPQADYYYVVRVAPDGSEWLVADNLSSSQQAIDPLPPLGVEFAYRVVAVAASGTETPTLAHAIKETNAWAFGFGAGVAETALLIASPSAQSSWQHGGESYHFADGTGETLPVFYGVGTLDVAHSWSFVIPKKWRDTAEDVQRLFRQHATCWVRDPFGHRWFVAAKATVKVGPGPKWDVSVTADEMRFKEGS